MTINSCWSNMSCWSVVSKLYFFNNQFQWLLGIQQFHFVICWIFFNFKFLTLKTKKLMFQGGIMLASCEFLNFYDTLVGMWLSSSNSQAPSSDLNSRGCKNWEGMLKVGIWFVYVYNQISLPFKWISCWF